MRLRGQNPIEMEVNLLPQVPLLQLELPAIVPMPLPEQYTGKHPYPQNTGGHQPQPPYP